MATKIDTHPDMEQEFLKHYQNLLKNPRFSFDLLQDSFIEFYPYLLRCIREDRQINPFVHFKVVYERNKINHYHLNKRYIWCDQSWAFDRGSDYTPGYAGEARHTPRWKDNFNGIF
ncbi:MAG: hypothetical protein LBS20_10995 [Prevotella sp.]|jgi:hypothetical protein|nr:hypothetical protein [Prevotella sp.]